MAKSKTAAAIDSLLASLSRSEQINEITQSGGGVAFDTKVVETVELVHVALVLPVGVLEVDCQDHSDGELEDEDGVDDDPVSQHGGCSLPDLHDQYLDVADDGEAGGRQHEGVVSLMAISVGTRVADIVQIAVGPGLLATRCQIDYLDQQRSHEDDDCHQIGDLHVLTV